MKKILISFLLLAGPLSAMQQPQKALTKNFYLFKAKKTVKVTFTGLGTHQRVGDPVTFTKNELDQNLSQLISHQPSVRFLKRVFNELGVKVRKDTLLDDRVVEANPSIIKLLIEKGADVNVTDADGFTPFHFYASSLLYYDGNQINRILPLFKKSHFDINAKSVDGYTPLHLVVNKNSKLFKGSNPEKIIKTLCKYGADINAQNSFGQTCLHIAVSSGNIHSTQALLKHGARANVLDAQGNSPLHLALAKDDGLPLVTVLLENGVDPNFKTENGFSPIYLAFQFQSKPLIHLLLSYGAKGNAQDINHVNNLMKQCFIEDPALFRSIKREYSKTCQQCGKTKQEVKKLKRCSKCKLVYYCSTNCQKEHITQHRENCKNFARLNASFSQKKQIQEYPCYVCQTPTVKTCTCKTIYYCSKDCQRSHWKVHKLKHRPTKGKQKEKQSHK